jgi:hypothetical protein
MKEQSLVLAIEALLAKYTEESGLLVTNIQVSSTKTSTYHNKSASYQLTITVTSEI